MSYIIYPQENKKLAIIFPVGDIQNAINDIPANTPYTIVDTLDNIDKVYFDGFIYEDGEARADIARCKAVHLNKLRKARKPLLQKLDIDYMKALETGDTVKANEIAIKKQELRDITNISLPDTLEGIKSTWPDILA